MVSCNPSLNLTVFNQLHPLFFPKFQLVVPYIASLVCENACRTSAEKLIPFLWSRGAFLSSDLFHRLKIPASTIMTSSGERMFYL